MAHLSRYLPPSLPLPPMIHSPRIGSWGNSSRVKLSSLNSPHEILPSLPPIIYCRLFQIKKRAEEASVNSSIIEAVRDTKEEGEEHLPEVHRQF